MKTVTVDANALRQVLQAILGPDHYIRELKVIHNLYQKLPGNLADNPLGLLIQQYNEAATACEEEEEENELP